MMASLTRRLVLLVLACLTLTVGSGCTVGIIGAVIGLIIGQSGDDGGNVAPSVVIGSISRTDGQVAIPLTVVDANGDTVTLTVEYDDGGGFQPATTSPPSAAGTSGGTGTVVTWDAPTDLGSTTFVSGILIRVTPSDGELTGNAVTSSAFNFGNDAPVVTLVSVDTDPQGKISGDAVVRFTVSDTAADTINVTGFEYSELGDFSDAVTVTLTTGQGNNFPSGSLTNLTSSVGGTQHSFSWDSFLSEPNTTTGSRIRLQVSDNFGGDSGFVQSEPAFDIANSTFITIGTITRATADVTIPVVVFNTSDLNVTLTTEYSLNGGTDWFAASTTPPQIQGTSGGNPGNLTWDADGDIGSTAYQGSVLVRITPDDGVSTGPIEVSSSFAYGNNAPAISAASVDDDGGRVSGNVVVRFTVSDDASDGIDITSFQYAQDGTFDGDEITVPLTTGQAGNFPSGTLTGLTTTVGGIEHAITWNSELTANFNQVGMKVRVQVTDVFTGVSNYQETAAFEIRNADSNPPVATIIGIKSPDSGGLRTGVVGIDYRLFDDDGDFVDVRIEYSTDGKQNWNTCSEYPSPFSESPYDLAATSGGIVHRFVWDAEADLGGQQPVVHVRVLPAATDGIGIGAETSIDVAIGYPGGADLFSPKSDTAAGTSPIHLATADFNRDGRMDVAVVANGDSQVRILLGDGDGTFTLGDTIGTGNNPQQIAIGDINNDGRPDIAVCNLDDDTVTLATSDGDGTFTAAGTVATGLGPRGILLGFFDANANIDMAVSNSGTTTVSILLGDGLGGFTPDSTPTVTNSPAQIIGGDFNNDGVLDLAVGATAGNRIQILDGVGDGTFTTGNAPTATQVPLSLSAADFNGDGDLDLAVVSSRTNTQAIQILIGAGDGTFATGTAPLAGGVQPNRVVCGDYNNDGIIDLLAVTVIGNTLSLLTGVGDGTFNTAITYACGQGPTALVATDLNNDGILDAVAANNLAGENDISAFIGRRTGDTWNRTLSGGDVLGSTTLPTGNDFHTIARVNRLGVRRWLGESTDGPDDRDRGGHSESHSFLNLVRMSDLSPAAPAIEALTDPWTVSGIIRLHRGTDPGTTQDTGSRLQPMSRFGDRVTPGSNTDLTREGLDLSLALASQRGIIVELAINSSRTQGEIDTAVTADRIHVYLRATDWLRAADIAADPMNGETGLEDLYLPRVDDGGGFRDLIVERHTWVAIPQAPNNDINDASATGIRFEVDSGGGVVRVLLDRDGSLQAFFEE